jgi:hypothetical protein
MTKKHLNICNHKTSLKPSKFGLGIFVIVMVSVILIQVSLITSSQALTRYFNCITRIANGNGTLTLTNVEGCYYKVFQGAVDADPDGHKLKK